MTKKDFIVKAALVRWWRQEKAMAEADNNSFEYNKRHGPIWQDSEGIYHPVITDEDCEEENDYE